MIRGLTTRAKMPLFVNFLVFLLLSLVAAELVNIAIVLTLPRPEPEFYSVAEVEQALLSGAAPAHPASGGGPPPLIIGTRADPPKSQRIGEYQARIERRIMRDIGAAPGNVVFFRPVRGPMFLRPPPAPPPGPSDRRWAGGAGGRLGFPAGLGGPGRADSQILMIAPFTVALKVADGSWRVVETRRRGLLDPWEQQILIWFLVSAAALTPLAYLFARSLSAPIAAFASAAERLGRDPNAPPLEVRGSAEIGVAAQAFNEMQGRLRRYVEDRTSMIGAVAHDLRTPLTRLRFHIEEVPEDVRAKMAADIAQMDAMVAEVLSFVRDASQHGAHARLELSSLLDTVADQFAELGADVSVQHAERAVVEGDSLALKRMFANLFDNAIKFGGRAYARLRRDGDAFVVDIEDGGPGLPTGELETVFEPFRRAEPSRSRDTGGMGLGLTVARSIARAHGGDVTLDNLAEGGLLARVRLPV